MIYFIFVYCHLPITASHFSPVGGGSILHQKLAANCHKIKNGEEGGGGR